MSVLQVNNITDTGGSTLLGRRNAIINGNFDVWQRGTSQTAGGYGSADRWNSSIGTSTQSVSQQTFTVGQTDVPNNPKYFYRNVVTTGSTAGSYAAVQYKIEGVETFAGETVTLSFYAKADSSKNIAVEFTQYFGTGGSPSTAISSIEVTTVALTSSWAKYTVTVDIPSVSGKTLGTNGNDFLRFYFWLDAGSDFNARTNSLGNQSGTFDIAQVQLEKGSVATAFERRSYWEELALCERYYRRWDNVEPEHDRIPSNGGFSGSMFLMYEEMRAAPTASYSDFEARDAGNNSQAIASVNTTATRGAQFITSGEPAGGTFRFISASGYLELDAEL